MPWQQNKILKHRNTISFAFACLLEGLTLSCFVSEKKTAQIQPLEDCFDVHFFTPQLADQTDKKKPSFSKKQGFSHLKGETTKNSTSAFSSQGTTRQEPTENNTQKGSVEEHAHSSTHGPILLYAPKPEIPEHLKYQELKSSVTILFWIKSNGSTEVFLQKSAHHYELDQIALATTKRWRFQAARENGIFIESKHVMQIDFEIND